MIILCCFMKKLVVLSLSMLRHHDMGGLEEDEGLHRMVDAEFQLYQVHKFNSEGITTHTKAVNLPPQ